MPPSHPPMEDKLELKMIVEQLTCQDSHLVRRNGLAKGTIYVFNKQYCLKEGQLGGETGKNIGESVGSMAENVVLKVTP